MVRAIKLDGLFLRGHEDEEESSCEEVWLHSETLVRDFAYCLSVAGDLLGGVFYNLKSL